jgi:tetratricopeptide (TPR) repeat protein
MGKHFDRAEILIEQGKYDLAEAALREEIAENPDLDRGYTTLAQCLINERKLTSETLELINHALSLNAENDWNYYLLCLYWYYRNDFERAILAIQVAIELDANSYFYFYILASILFDRGQAKFEIDTKASRMFQLFWVSYFIKPYLKPVWHPLEKSLSLNPQYLPTLNLQTNLLGATGQIKRALYSSSIALQIDSSNAIAHGFHGQILTEYGMYSEAIKYFQSALRIEPDYKQAKYGLLEAMRSQYWIYPWISITNWRGKLIFILTLPIGIIAVLAIRNMLDESSLSKDRLELLVYATMATIMISSFPSQLIFNSFLRLEEKNKLLINIQDAIVANYTTGLTATLLLATYAAMIFGNNADRHTEMTIVSIIGGIIIATMTFYPVNSQSKLPILSIGYQLSVAILGIISMVVYIKFNDLERICPLFGFLVLGSSLIATSVSPGWTYPLGASTQKQNSGSNLPISQLLEDWLTDRIDLLSIHRSIESRFISKWFILIFTELVCFSLMISGGILFVFICRSVYHK